MIVHYDFIINDLDCNMEHCIKMNGQIQERIRFMETGIFWLTDVKLMGQIYIQSEVNDEEKGISGGHRSVDDRIDDRGLSRQLFGDGAGWNDSPGYRMDVYGF